MEGETGKTCPSCGAPLKEGAAFCTGCGAAVEAPGASAATPPAGPPVAPPATAPGMAPVEARKRGRAPLIVGVIGGVLVLAGIVVLVLWLTMWRDGGAGSGDPLDLAEKYISAMEKGDAEAYIECFDPDYFAGDDTIIFEEMGMDLEELLKMSMQFMDVKFESYALELEYERGDEARVVTTDGSATFSIMGMSESVDLADDPMVFDMVRRNGRWYLSEDPMPASLGSGMDFDMDFEDLDYDDMDFDEFNLDDLDEFLPEGYDFEDMENMSPEEMERMLEEFERMMEEYSQ